MDMRGVGYIFMAIIFVLFITDGFAAEKKKPRLNDFSIHYLAFQHTDSLYAVLDTSNDKENFDNSLIEKEYNQFVLDAILLTAYEMKELCESKYYKEHCKNALSKMEDDKMSKLREQASDDLEQVLQRVSYLDDNLDSGGFKVLHQETQELHTRIPFKYFMKVGSNCGENRGFFCAYKLKDIIQDKSLGLMSKLKDSIGDIYEKKGLTGRNIASLPSLTEVKAELEKNKVKKEIIEEIKDSARNMHGFVNEIKGMP